MSRLVRLWGQTHLGLNPNLPQLCDRGHVSQVLYIQILSSVKRGQLFFRGLERDSVQLLTSVS